MTADSYGTVLPNGIRLTFIPAAKFKTISMALFIHQELSADKATLTALLPSVLERGSRLYPDNMALRRALEELYGAELSTDVHKKGERHLLSCSLEMIHGKYVGEGEQMLRRGLSILGGIMGDPLVVDGGFKEEYVAQEKEQLANLIRGLINDKALYAVERCLQIMCARERYGVFKYGRLEDLERISPASLWRYYREILSANPAELYVVGDLEARQVEAAAREAIYFHRGPQRDGLPETEVYVEPSEVSFVEERLPVEQAKLVMGYRTNIAYRDPSTLRSWSTTASWEASRIPSFSLTSAKRPAWLTTSTPGWSGTRASCSSPPALMGASMNRCGRSLSSRWRRWPTGRSATWSWRTRAGGSSTSCAPGKTTPTSSSTASWTVRLAGGTTR